MAIQILPSRLIVVFGLPGAGKSTYIKQFVPSPSLDDIHIEFDSIRRMFGIVYAEYIEPAVWGMALAAVEAALFSGRTVFIDESITMAANMGLIHDLAKRTGAELHGVVIDTPSYTCWQNRKDTGFPQHDFERKLHEWTHNKAAILCMCDSVEFLRH